MAILNNPMGALAAVNVQTVGSNVQSVGSVVANGARDRVVVVAAGKGNHEMYTCCGLCEDIEQHNFAFDRLYRQTMSALQSGDIPGGIALGAEATEEYYARQGRSGNFRLEMRRIDGCQLCQALHYTPRGELKEYPC